MDFASASSTPPVIEQIVDGKYRLESTLGRGGMGIVFAARHMLSQRRVALKWLDPALHRSPAARALFLREAEALGRIDHPNVVGVLDVGTSEEGSYLVMELLRGESLRALLDRRGPLPAHEAVELLLPVVAGVEAAHRVNVVHRDLKPENLFLTPSENEAPASLRILDFGVAKLDGDVAGTSDVREVGATTDFARQLGTPRYMSPEQVAGDTTDARTDVWGLGSLLYEMLTGHAPFEVCGEARLFAAIANEPITHVATLAPHVPPAIAAAVMRALEKSPAARHPSAAAFGRAIGKVMRLRFREPRAISVSRLHAVGGTPIDTRPAEHARRDATTVNRNRPRRDVARIEAPAPAPASHRGRMLLFALLVLVIVAVLTGVAVAAAAT